MQQLKYPLDKVSQTIITDVIKKETAFIKKVLVQKTHSDFQVAGLTKDITIFELPPRAEILTVWMNVKTAFAGCTTYTISMGKNGAETGLQTAQDVKTTGLKLAVGTDFTTNRPIYSVSAKTIIEAKATATVENLDQSTAGVIDFYIIYVQH